MTSNSTTPPGDDELPDSSDVHDEFAAAFDKDTDPLKKYSTTFKDLPDPFEYYIKNVLYKRETISSETTYENYRRTYRQWRTHMAATTDNRHPACPNVEHVRRFIPWLRDVHDNSRSTINGKLSRLSSAYAYWQAKTIFPHPPNWNPFDIGKTETNLGTRSTKEYPDLSLEDLRATFSSITNIRERSIVGQQVKQGLRAGEISNLQLADLHITHQTLQNQYPELGTNPALGDHTDVVYIPHDRDGNKSANPRLLPIDDELRWLLLRHLLTRPHVDEPWVYLSQRTFTQMESQGVNRAWTTNFHPEYEETDTHAAITSHYGRHCFSSYWRLQEGMNREHVQYMRGDRVQPLDSFPNAIDDYLHPNYQLIEDTYRKNIFKLNISLDHSRHSV